MAAPHPAHVCAICVLTHALYTTLTYKALVFHSREWRCHWMGKEKTELDIKTCSPKSFVVPNEV